MSSEQPQSPSIGLAGTVASNPVRDTITLAFSNRGFVMCLALLLVSLLGYQVLIRITGTEIIKKAVPIQKPLKLLDRSKLAPYQLIPGGAVDIKAEMLDALGTTEYIQWSLEDTAAINTPLPQRLVHFFVTYYTGDPGQVPHVPEECYLGGGYDRQSEELVEVPIPDLQQTVAFKVLTFERSDFLSRDSRVVMYTFHTNGRFAPDRHVVRTILNSPRDEYAYFSKVEISFGTSDVSLSREQAIETGKRFLQKAIPVLVNDHWPDWQKVQGKGSTESEPAGMD